MIGLGASDLDDYLRQAAQEQGRTLTPDPEPEKGFYYRSDHFNFAKQGVPALDPDSGVDYIGKSPEWGKKKREEYTAKDYHAPSDQVKPDWDLSGAAEDAQLLLAVGYRVANADRLPEWKPGNEFKAKRDGDAAPVNLVPRRSLQPSVAAAHARRHACRAADAGPRHRRQHRDLPGRA